MKKMLSLALVVLLCFGLCGCCCMIGGSSKNSDIQNPLEQFLGGDTPTEGVADTIPVTIIAHEEHTMPACRNKSLDTVIRELSAINVQIELAYEYDDQIPEDHIISQSVPAGETVTFGASVFLVVSLGRDESPYGYSQKLVVTAPKGSSTATVVFYEWSNGDWKECARYRATVGKNGIGATREGSRKTPQGIHKLGAILSCYNVQTNLPVYRATSHTAVVNDLQSSYYNFIMEESTIPEGTSFDRIGNSLSNGSTYAMIYIEHNGSGFSSDNVVVGNGSAIGVRGQYGSLSATYGDVDISYEDMLDLISRLDMEKNPMIEIKTS